MTLQVRCFSSTASLSLPLRMVVRAPYHQWSHCRGRYTNTTWAMAQAAGTGGASISQWALTLVRLAALVFHLRRLLPSTFFFSIAPGRRSDVGCRYLSQDRRKWRAAGGCVCLPACLLACFGLVGPGCPLFRLSSGRAPTLQRSCPSSWSPRRFKGRLRRSGNSRRLQWPPVYNLARANNVGAKQGRISYHCLNFRPLPSHTSSTDTMATQTVSRQIFNIS